MPAGTSCRRRTCRCRSSWAGASAHSKRRGARSKRSAASPIIARAVRCSPRAFGVRSGAMKPAQHALVILGLSLTVSATAWAQRGQAPAPPPNPDGPYTVTLVPPVHGKVVLSPALPADGKYAKGTVVTVTTTPDSGYALDSAWYSVPGRFGQMYHEGMAKEFKVTIDQDKRIGASFIEDAAVRDLVVTNDVVFAKPGVKPLKYDVFAPKGARNLPIIVIVHGGGWVANDEDIMRGLARELTKGGKFVVASIDYRWAGKEDGDATGTTMADIIGDVFGGIAHIAEHATEYGGDATR